MGEEADAMNDWEMSAEGAERFRLRLEQQKKPKRTQQRSIELSSAGIAASRPKPPDTPNRRQTMLDDVIKVELADMRFHLNRYHYWSECAGNVMPHARQTYQDEAGEHFRRAVHHHANAVGFAARTEQP